VNRQVEILESQNRKYQQLTNEAIAKNENNERELATQKEILRQFESSKKDYIAKLRRDIDTVDAKYQEQINQLLMVREDIHSQAQRTYQNYKAIKVHHDELQKRHSEQTAQLEHKTAQAEVAAKALQDDQMLHEDFICQVFYKTEQLTECRGTIREQEITIKSLTNSEAEAAK